MRIPSFGTAYFHGHEAFRLSPNAFNPSLASLGPASRAMLLSNDLKAAARMAYSPRQIAVGDLSMVRPAQHYDRNWVIAGSLVR